MDAFDASMSRRELLEATGLAAASVPLLGANPPSSQHPRQSVARAAAPRQIEIAASGGWSWFGDPRALHHEGEYRRTYLGYITSTGDIGVAQYDHDTAELTKQVLMSGFQVDDHNVPAIVVRPDRRVVLFWSGHADGNLPIHYRRSAVPEDINAGWEPIKQVTTNTAGRFGWTYPTPVQLSAEGNALYLFWRGGDFNPNFSITTGGDIWTAAKTYITNPGQRPYVKMHSDGVDTIHFAFTQGHPRNVPSSIYYMSYRAGSLYRADGTRIGPWGTPVTPDQADKVYDADTSPNPKAWVWDVAADADGRPVIVYANFPTDTDHRYRYARWTGTGWLDRELVAAGTYIDGPSEPNYSGGIYLDHTNPSIVLLSRQMPSGRYEIQRWTTPDKGATWSVEKITNGSADNNVRPIKPVGLRGNGALSALWMAGSYPSYTTFQTRIMGLR
jgi:hypothetical protein